MGYAEGAMAELHGDRMIDNTPPTVQAAYARAAETRMSGERLPAVLHEVGEELERARATHAPMNGHHEGYAVLLEEMDELWDVCKRNTHKLGESRDKTILRRLKRAEMRKEALQIAAMAVRFIEDVCDKAE